MYIKCEFCNMQLKKQISLYKKGEKIYYCSLKCMIDDLKKTRINQSKDDYTIDFIAFVY